MGVGPDALRYHLLREDLQLHLGTSSREAGVTGIPIERGGVTSASILSTSLLFQGNALESREVYARDSTKGAAKEEEEVCFFGWRPSATPIFLRATLILRARAYSHNVLFFFTVQVNGWSGEKLSVRVGVVR